MLLRSNMEREREKVEAEGEVAVKEELAALVGLVTGEEEFCSKMERERENVDAVGEGAAEETEGESMAGKPRSKNEESTESAVRWWERRAPEELSDVDLAWKDGR